MKIDNITITNVKSFKDKTSISFDPTFNIIIGPNASGKSNLLDIINITLRHFFLKSYQFQQQSNAEKPQLQPFQPFQAINSKLDSYMTSIDAKEIEITFIVKQEDIDNIEFLRISRQKIVDIFKARVSYPESFIQHLSSEKFDYVTLKLNETITYKITDNVLSTHIDLYPLPQYQGAPANDEHDMKRQLFLLYLNFIQAVGLFAEELLPFEFKPSLLLLSPYRMGNSEQDFKGVLSSSNSSTLKNGLLGTTSKTSNSMIQMATIYFSEKRRKFEEHAYSIPFGDAWRADPEVSAVSKYLSKLNYTWDLSLVNSNNNTYEITLERNGFKLNLTQASSGEKEIINYLFGIFALNIKNGLIIIDEPELHLHPRWQLLLLDLFKGLSDETGNQFIITTHSAVFINIKTVSNLIRVFRKDNISKHVRLGNNETIDVKDLLHLVNSTNNEKVFFADLVILVEGATDLLVFQKLFEKAILDNDILSVVEVVSIMGKGNIKKFRNYLDYLQIPYYFIADLDYVNETGTAEIKALFKDGAGIDGNVLRNGNSEDGKKLITILEEAVDRQNFEKAKQFIAYMKAKRKKLRDDLNPTEKKLLNKFIDSRHPIHEYILSEGAIERYFPEHLSSKDLDNVLLLLEDNEFSKWENSSSFKLLWNIVKNILKSAGLKT